MVLKMKAAKASANTPSQLPACSFGGEVIKNHNALKMFRPEGRPPRVHTHA
ncbi:hypothetical protein ALQ20_103013 [Pseudomonas syringae pv. atrofaciens]|nr:hypothetical protein ALQ54_101700 [Pseudomonas syringae]RMP59688.1 hypothetical protein ALQ20_103013 [Pseudomonas syringae pv. atrofaciens]